MPECRTAFEEVEETMTSTFESMLAKWLEAKDLHTQKEFALAVKDHPMNSMLFKLRKKCPDATREDVAALWRKSGEFIVKNLFFKKRFKFDILLYDHLGDH
jgi:hypothetical protein